TFRNSPSISPMIPTSATPLLEKERYPSNARLLCVRFHKVLHMHWIKQRHLPRHAWAIMFALSSLRASAQTPTPTAASDQKPDAGAPTAPLTIHIGDADLLFGGFIDATAIRRDVNTGSGLGTSFGTIPFGNTVQGHMSDTQFSSQNSRLTLEATSTLG